MLEHIKSPEDIKNLSDEELSDLAAEIRAFLIEHVTENGGHLSSNLGSVELILALHRVFDAPMDKILFDVGHQAYTHKILTGRAAEFDRLRMEDGLSGFTRQEESEYDVYDSGHASDSVSFGLGLCRARDMAGENYHVVSVIGDGALSGGLAFEGLNDAGKSKHKLIVVLNDNAMSIGKSVGSVALHLSLLRTRKNYIERKSRVKTALLKTRFGTGIYNWINTTKDRIKYFVMKNGILFEEMGFTYMGPVDGHNIGDLEAAFRNAKETKKPVIVHVRTQKGRGFEPAEKDPERYHVVAPRETSKSSAPSFSELAGQALLQEAEKCDGKMAVITAAMAYSCGLQPLSEKYPHSVIDVGIEEEHALSMSAGLAKGGVKTYVTMYSSFAQRAYDELLEDVVLNRQPVCLLLDRSSLSGGDGKTHHGIYDLSFLQPMPELTILSPSDEEEMRLAMRFAAEFAAPLVVRYPRGAAPAPLGEHTKMNAGRARVIGERGTDVALWALGTRVTEAVKAAEMLRVRGLSVTVVDARFVKPFDEALLTELAQSHKLILSIEEHVQTGGFGGTLCTYINNLRDGKSQLARFYALALPDAVMEQGNRGKMLRDAGLDADGIAAKALELLGL